MENINFFLAIALFTMFCCLSCRSRIDRSSEHTKSKSLKGLAVKIVDGDTFDVYIKDSATIRIRLTSIDTPERTQDYYQVAKDALAAFIFGKEVTLELAGSDRYQRSLATVFYQGKNINMEMVKQGYAWQYLEYDTSVEYASAEKDARERKLGLWSQPNPISPWDFKKLKKKERKESNANL